MGANNSIEETLGGESIVTKTTSSRFETYGWKRFRYCPRVTNEPRNLWTTHGYHRNNCFPVVGKVAFPPNTHLSRAWGNSNTATEARLVPGSLERMDGPTDKSLNDENGVVSSIFDRNFEYPEGKVVQSTNWNRGLSYYTSRSDALDDSTGPINIDGEQTESEYYDHRPIPSYKENS
jgi:hypothetical protein